MINTLSVIRVMIHFSFVATVQIKSHRRRVHQNSRRKGKGTLRMAASVAGCWRNHLFKFLCLIRYNKQEGVKVLCDR